MRPPASQETAVSSPAASLLAGPWALAILFLLAALPYIGVLRNDFTYVYDDKALILDNPYVHNFHHLPQILTGTLFSNLGSRERLPYYRPIANLTFLLGYQLFGPLAYGFHLASFLLNVAVAGLLFIVAEQLFRDRLAAFFAAGLFALHPVHVEAVAWISSVTDIEVTLFCLLAFWFFLQVQAPAGGSKNWTLAAMTGSFVLAVFSKEQAVTLPLLATIYEHFYREDRRETTWLQKSLRYGPLWLVCLLYAALRVRLMGSFAHSTQVNPITTGQTILSALALSGQYVAKLIWPVNLSAFHPFHASTTVFELHVLLGIFALVLGTALFIAMWKRARPASFGIIWLTVTLAPVLNARWMSAYVLGERYLYLPSAGFCLVGGWACGRGWRSVANRNRPARAVAVTAGCVLATLGMVRIGLRVQDWHDDITLLTRTLATQPDDFRLHDALGSAYWIRRDPRDAEREWQESLRLQPDNINPLTSLGALYAEEKRYDLALPYLEKALVLSPGNAGAHLNLGAAYAETGRFDRAEEQFRAAVLLTPANLTAHNVLGKLYYDSNRLAEAEQQFRESVQCEPNLAACDYLGYIYMRWGDRERAEKAFRAALTIKSTDSHAHYNLGLIYAATGKNSQAVEEMKAALATDPQNADVISALAKLQR